MIIFLAVFGVTVVLGVGLTVFLGVGLAVVVLVVVLVVLVVVGLVTTRRVVGATIGAVEKTRRGFAVVTTISFAMSVVDK